MSIGKIIIDKTHHRSISLDRFLVSQKEEMKTDNKMKRKSSDNAKYEQLNLNNI